MLLGRRSLRSLVLCCRCWRLARRASRALLVRAPGSPPGRKRGSGAPTAFCSLRAAAPSSVARRPRASAPRPPGCPPPARRVPVSPGARGSRPLPSGRFWACRLCRALCLLGGCPRGSPRASGGFFSPLRTQLFFLRAPVRKLGKIRPKKTAKDPRKSGVFSSLDNIGGNCRAFLHEVAPSYPQEKFRFFAKKQDTPCKDCFSVLLSEW